MSKTDLVAVFGGGTTSIRLLAKVPRDISVLCNPVSPLAFPYDLNIHSLSMCWICLLMVKNSRINQYSTSTGQNTGRLKISDQLQQKPITMARVAEYQNLNSGRRRTKGLNSSFCLVGSDEEPSSMPSSASRPGSNFGLMKARKRFRR